MEELAQSAFGVARFFFFFFFFFKSSGGWVKIQLKLPHFHLIRHMSCFDLTHAPVATAARAAATGMGRESLSLASFRRIFSCIFFFCVYVLVLLVRLSSHCFVIEWGFVLCVSCFCAGCRCVSCRSVFFSLLFTGGCILCVCVVLFFAFCIFGFFAFLIVVFFVFAFLYFCIFAFSCCVFCLCFVSCVCFVCHVCVVYAPVRRKLEPRCRSPFVSKAEGMVSVCACLCLGFPSLSCYYRHRLCVFLFI